MKYSKLTTSLAATIVLVSVSLIPALVAVSAASSNDPVVKTVSGVSYVSGGVGTDSIDKLSLLAGNFNLKLVFALNSGDYVADVGVVIVDAGGKTLLNTMSDGPWFLTKLPTGNYQILATLSGNTVKRQVSIGTAKLRTVDFRWVAE